MQRLVACLTYVYISFCYKRPTPPQQQPLLIQLNTLRQQPTPPPKEAQHQQLANLPTDQKANQKQRQRERQRQKDSGERMTIREYEKAAFIEEEFQSIDSYYESMQMQGEDPFEATVRENPMREKESGSKRIRLSVKQADLLKSLKSSEEREQLMKYSSYRWGEFNNDYSFNLKDEAEDMLSWMERNYPFRIHNKNIRICYAIRLKVQGREMLKLLHHKLEDFKIFYVTQSRETLFQYSSLSSCLRADFKINELGSSTIKASKIMSFYRIECATVNIGKLLRTFKSEDLFRTIHQFKNMTIVNNNGMGLNLQFPVLEVQEMGSKTKEERVFHLGFQLGQIESKGSVENKQILQIAYSLDEGQRSFQRILKIEQGQKGSVEIYTESSEEVVCSYDQYFRSKFKALSQWLLRNKMLRQ